MKFEKINNEKFNSLTIDELGKMKGGLKAGDAASSMSVILTYHDVKNDENESDRKMDED